MTPPGVCCICGKHFEDGAPYACVWDLPRVGFAHLACTEGLEDITDEMKEAASAAPAPRRQ